MFTLARELKRSVRQAAAIETDSSMMEMKMAVRLLNIGEIRV